MTKLTQALREGGKARAVLVLLGLTLLSAVSILGCKSSSRASNASTTRSPAPQIKGVVHLESSVVNLADPNENHFFRVGIDLGLANSSSAKEAKEAESAFAVARIRDCILSVLSTWTSEALLAPEGKKKLKDQLVGALRQRAPELDVQEVYFTDFLVQR